MCPPAESPRTRPPAATPVGAPPRPLAVVTGASRGIGRELARGLGERGHDLVVAARSDAIHAAAADLRATGADVTAVQADLAEPGGVTELHDRIAATGRPVAVAALNAGTAVGGGTFVATDLARHLRLVGLNVTSTVHLAHLLLSGMAAHGSGRMLLTSSVAATSPGPNYATYAASKAFVQSFAAALRAELAGTGVTVTTLMPGPTDTAIFERGGLGGSVAGRAPKDDPRRVAGDGLDALFRGRAHVVAGPARNHLPALLGHLLPEDLAARLHGLATRPR